MSLEVVMKPEVGMKGWEGGVGGGGWAGGEGGGGWVGGE